MEWEPLSKEQKVALRRMLMRVNSATTDKEMMAACHAVTPSDFRMYRLIGYIRDRALARREGWEVIYQNGKPHSLEWVDQLIADELR